MQGLVRLMTRKDAISVVCIIDEGQILVKWKIMTEFLLLLAACMCIIAAVKQTLHMYEATRAPFFTE